eukprot:361074-Chlamydomonas_euryale.AAC.5
MYARAGRQPHAAAGGFLPRRAAWSRCAATCVHEWLTIYHDDCERRMGVGKTGRARANWVSTAASLAVQVGTPSVGACSMACSPHIS